MFDWKAYFYEYLPEGEDKVELEKMIKQILDQSKW
jgi:hypothetical protein